MPSIVIPRELAGLHAHAKKEAPLCGARRVHDWDGRHRWCDTEKAGAYDFADLDMLAAQAVQGGFTLIDCLGGTPQAYATTSTPDPYGSPGGGSMPRDLSTLEAYAFARAKHLNFRSPANPTRKQLVRISEPLNEPRYVLPELSVDDSVAWTAAANAGTKRADKRIICTSPSFGASNPTHLADFLLAGGRKIIDAVAIHPYNCGLAAMMKAVVEIRRVMVDCGVGHLPIAITEYGFEPTYRAAFLALQKQAQADEWLRTMLYLASEGVICCGWYDWDGEHKPDVIYAMRDKPVLAAAFATLCGWTGKTLRYGDGDVRISGKAVPFNFLVTSTTKTAAIA